MATVSLSIICLSARRALTRVTRDDSCRSSLNIFKKAATHARYLAGSSNNSLNIFGPLPARGDALKEVLAEGGAQSTVDVPPT